MKQCGRFYQYSHPISVFNNPDPRLPAYRGLQGKIVYISLCIILCPCVSVSVSLSIFFFNTKYKPSSVIQRNMQTLPFFVPFSVSISYSRPLFVSLSFLNCVYVQCACSPLVFLFLLFFSTFSLSLTLCFWSFIFHDINLSLFVCLCLSLYLWFFSF